MNLERPSLNLKPSCSKSRSVRRGGALNVTSVHDVLVDHCYTTASECCHHRINSWTFDVNELGGKGNEPMVDNHSRSVHLCSRDCIAWNSRVFKPLHPVSGIVDTPSNILQLAQALKAGDHSHNFELWCLVLSVELVWYIQRSKLQPVLPVYDSNISILLHKQQYQLSEFSFPCTCQLWSLFERSTQGWLYGLRKATLLTVDPVMAASWSNSVTMVNKKHHELMLHSEHHPSIRIGF